MFFEFFRWWYGPGWIGAWKSTIKWTKNVQREFSIPVLLKTLFAPWKRIIAPPGRSLDEKMRGLLDNLTSRAVGFSVRAGALVASVFMTAFTFLAGLAFTVIWPLLPVLVVYLFYRSVAG